MNLFKSNMPRPSRMKRFGNEYEFDPAASEVSILDRSGRAIWKKRKGEEPAPIRWTGINFIGQTIESGDYICKIVYLDEKVAYLPFVFMKRG